jgi:hypothetical protein
MTQTHTLPMSAHCTWIDNVIGAIFAVIVFSVFFFIFNPIKPMVYTEATVLTPEVVAGEMLEVVWGTQWRRMCSGESKRWAITHEGEVKQLDGMEITPPAAPGWYQIDRKVMIPANFPKGVTQFWTTATFHCWPNQTFTDTSPRLTFTVL